MRYADAPEQEAWRQEVRRFVRRHVTPALRAELRARGNEGEGPLARAFHRQLFDKGWWGIGWPKEFGGLGKSAVDQYIFIEEMEAAGAPGMRLSITSVAPTIRRVGTDAQAALAPAHPARRDRVRDRLLGARRRDRPRSAQDARR